MSVSVIGCGRWGSFLAWYIEKIGQSVTLYGREISKTFQSLRLNRQNDTVTIPETILLTSSLAEVLASDIIIVSVGSQSFRRLLEEIKEFNPQNKIFVLCMKGVEIKTGKRLSEIAEENLDFTNKVAVWLGPGHVQEFTRGIPNCMVIDSKDVATKEFLAGLFSSELVRFYYGQDLIGNEIGAAAKNVIGIAAGMLDGLGLSTLKGALMSRGTREIARLIKAMGGIESSAYGLCHLGDYEATVFSKFSHNRKYGELLVMGKKYDSLAEGYYTALAFMKLEKKYGVELPICRAVYSVLYENVEPRTGLELLFSRSIKEEFYE